MCGIKYDTDKDRWDLLPWESVREVVKVITFGAKKYSDNNWRKVSKDRYFAAAHRHLVAYRLGEIKDSESSFEHLAHAICCILFIMELDDEVHSSRK